MPPPSPHPDTGTDAAVAHGRARRPRDKQNKGAAATRFSVLLLTCLSVCWFFCLNRRPSSASTRFSRQRPPRLTASGAPRPPAPRRPRSPPEAPGRKRPCRERRSGTEGPGRRRHEHLRPAGRACPGRTGHPCFPGTAPPKHLGIGTASQQRRGSCRWRPPTPTWQLVLTEAPWGRKVVVLL